MRPATGTTNRRASTAARRRRPVDGVGAQDQQDDAVVPASELAAPATTESRATRASVAG